MFSQRYERGSILAWKDEGGRGPEPRVACELGVVGASRDPEYLYLLPLGRFCRHEAEERQNSRDQAASRHGSTLAVEGQWPTNAARSSAFTLRNSPVISNPD